MGKKLALGKGIASLLQETPNQILRSNLSDGPQVGLPSGTEADHAKASTQGDDLGSSSNMMSVDKIKTNPDQPRKIFDEIKLDELAESIKENGILQPLIVTKVDDAIELVAGERRLRAARLAGLSEVPVVYKRTTEKERKVFAILENVQRDDLNCVEEALAYYQLISELKLTQEEVAKKLGKSRASISNLLRLLKLPRQVIDMLQKDEISLGHGKVLLSLDNEQDIVLLAKRSIQEELSVRDLERVIKARDQFKPKNNQVASNSSELLEKVKNLEERLESRLGSKIKLKYKGTSEKGSLSLVFKSKEEFNNLFDHLMG